MPTAIARAGADGNLLWSGQSVGSVSGTGVLLDPDLAIAIPKPHYTIQHIGSERHADGTLNTYRAVLDAVEDEPALARMPADGTVTVRYRPLGGDTGTTETYTLAALEFDLTRGYAERIVSGSTRFRLGGSTYVHQAGAIYRDPNPASGAGSVAGTLDPSTGRVRLTAWTAGGANAVDLDACTTEVGGQPVDEAVFRTPLSPIKPGTLQLRWSDCTGAVYSKTPSPTGNLEDGDCTTAVDFTRGQVRIRFGRWRPVSGLTAEDLAAVWYSAGAIVSRGGVDYIWQPRPALADSIVYNAVATTYLPPDSELLGLDAARLPPDGQALIYRPGMLVLIHHEETVQVPALVAGGALDCGRARLYRAVIEDSMGRRLPADRYTVDRVNGIVTLADPLDLAGFAGPWAVKHSVADLRRVRATDINGTLTLLKPVSYDFPPDAAVSGVLYIGTLQARVSHLFAQSTWTSEWSDARIGDAPLYQYLDTVYPILVTNAGAYPDRYLIQFTSATAFRLIGENQGILALGDINTDFEPVSALTGERMLFVDYRGWGLGWSAGGCLRFNVSGACYPADVVRAVQPSDPSEVSDGVELLLVGNVDA